MERTESLIERVGREAVERSQANRAAGLTWEAGSDTQDSEADKAMRRGIPALRMDDTFDSFDLARAPQMKVAYERVKAVADSRVWCALLCGEYGVGKSHLAFAAVNQWRAEGKPYRFWKTPDLLKLFRSSFDKDSTMNIQEVLKQYQRPFLLVLDDLGAEQATEWAMEQLYTVLDGRYENQAPTIITTNTSEARMDGRIKSRYRSGLVVCESEDQR